MTLKRSIDQVDLASLTSPLRWCPPYRSRNKRADGSARIPRASFRRCTCVKGLRGGGYGPAGRPIAWAAGQDIHTVPACGNPASSWFFTRTLWVVPSAATRQVAVGPENTICRSSPLMAQSDGSAFGFRAESEMASGLTAMRAAGFPGHGSSEPSPTRSPARSDVPSRKLASPRNAAVKRSPGRDRPRAAGPAAPAGRPSGCRCGRSASAPLPGHG